MRRFLSWRRLMGGMLAISGAALLVLGALQREPSYGILGLAAWVLIAIGIEVGMRYRIASNIKLGNAIRSDIQGLKGRHKGLARVMAQFTERQKKNRENSERMLTELRGITKAVSEIKDRQQESGDNFERTLGDLRRFVLDGHTLTLRTFRGITSSLESQEAAAEKALDLIGSASTDLTREIEQLSPSVKNTQQELLDEIRLLVAHLHGDKEIAKFLLDKVIENRKLSDNKLKRIKIDLVQEVEALLQLTRLLRPEEPLPLLGGWAMDPVAMLALVEEVLERKPRLIVECGSGTSTLWLAYALKHIGGGRIVSLDHLDEYAEKGRRYIETHELTDFAEIRSAPLESRTFGGEEFLWYSIAHTRDLPEDLDLLIVDGPPGKTGPQARYPALPALEKRLANGALIVVDDAIRVDEEAMIERWRNEFIGVGELRMMGRRTKAFEFSRVPVKMNTELNEN